MDTIRDILISGPSVAGPALAGGSAGTAFTRRWRRGRHSCVTAITRSTSAARPPDRAGRERHRPGGQGQADPPVPHHPSSTRRAGRQRRCPPTSSPATSRSCAATWPRSCTRHTRHSGRSPGENHARTPISAAREAVMITHINVPALREQARAVHPAAPGRGAWHLGARVLRRRASVGKPRRVMRDG